MGAWNRKENAGQTDPPTAPSNTKRLPMPQVERMKKSMRKTRWTKAVAGLLCLCMLLSLTPVAAFAEETVPQQTAPETTAPEETAPETTVPEESVPETTAPEETVPETIVPEETVPETTVPEETTPETTLPDTLALGDQETEFRRVTKVEELTSGGRYVIVSGTTDQDHHNKYLHHTKDENKTNHCTIDNPGEVIADAEDYAPQFKGSQAHYWKIEKTEDGYTIQSCTSDGKYLNYGTAGQFQQVPMSEKAEVFQLTPGENNQWQVTWEVDGVKTYFAYNAKWGAQTDPYGVYIYKEGKKSTDIPVLESDEGLLKAGADQVQKGTTSDQPFAPGTAGSNLFRIPALITLDNGWLFAAADARYATSGDGGGLDTIVSISKDNGATWEYSMPIFFPDSNGYAGNKATTVIDPIVVQGGDGTIYVMADANPTGVTTMGGYTMPGKGTGYVTVDGVERLALTSKYANVNKAPTDDNTDVYEYYVGDFGADGYAPVMDRKTKQPTEFAVDDCFNIYQKKGDTYVYPYQPQVNSDTKIQQNAFYKGSVLHVYNTGYLWLASSDDYGETWSHTILNPQIKRDSETGLLVSPGRGTVLRDGTIIIPMYNHYDTATSPNMERSSLIWSKDDGKTWHRTGDVSGNNGFSSECELVELPDGTLRLFVRSGTNCVAYADAHWNGSDYVWDTAVKSTGVPARSGCNVSAIMYSQTIDGKPAILVAQPGNPGARNQGRIWVFLLNEDNTMTLGYTFHVNETDFAYSCLTELEDGRVGLLWEYQGAAITMSTYDIRQIAPGGVVNNQRELDIPLYGTYTEKMTSQFKPDPMPDESILKLDIVDQTVTGMTAQLGNDHSYNGALVALDRCLYTFTGDNDSGWKVESVSVPGTYLNHGIKDVASCPGSKTPNQIRLEDGTQDGTYSLVTKATKGNTRLYFWKIEQEGKTFSFDRQSGADTSGKTDFRIYRPAAEGEKAAGGLIPGYVPVPREELVSGGKYLIAAEVGNDVFVLHPSVSTSDRYSHVAQVRGERSVTTSTVTYTGVSEGEVTFTDKTTGYTYTVRVAPKKLVEVTVNPGESTTLELPEGATELTRQPDAAIAAAEVVNVNAQDLVPEGDCPGSLGSDAAYNGQVAAMSGALYTFTKREDGHYTVSAQTSEGKTVYLNIKDGGANLPNQSAETPISVSNAVDGMVQITDMDSGGNGSILYFHRSNGRLVFDRNGRADAPNTSFYLYRTAKTGETGSAELPGYVRLKGADEVEDGGKYLIVAQAKDDYYALYPSASEDNAHAHVVKVDLDRVISRLKVTGVKSGVTDAVAGNTVYRITVPAEETQPTVPPTEGTKPTVPPTEDTKPTVPSTEGTEPTAPSTEESKPTAPSTEGTKPTAPSTEGTKPTAPIAPTGKPNTPATGDPAAAGLFAGIFFLALGMAVMLTHTQGKKRNG